MNRRSWTLLANVRHRVSAISDGACHRFLTLLTAINIERFIDHPLNAHIENRWRLHRWFLHILLSQPPAVDALRPSISKFTVSNGFLSPSISFDVSAAAQERPFPRIVVTGKEIDIRAGLHKNEGLDRNKYDECSLGSIHRASLRFPLSTGILFHSTCSSPLNPLKECIHKSSVPHSIFDGAHAPAQNISYVYPDFLIAVMPHPDINPSYQVYLHLVLSSDSHRGAVSSCGIVIGMMRSAAASPLSVKQRQPFLGLTVPPQKYTSAPHGIAPRIAHTCPLIFPIVRVHPHIVSSTHYNPSMWSCSLSSVATSSSSIDI
ncbi:hypothetical protein Hypma_007060 [Hypsizygus marmoreus]|uniref:Uncharacterized protein n=1 Tax=Hypsizygus marmoreus TaxID=39966 RepID=A0A369KHU7_HYPMA|nr:hypothetical protein Hypma_007060 [Hypsizygus marmoreus]